MTVDPQKLPSRALFDTMAVIMGLGGRANQDNAKECREAYEAMIERGHEILISTITVAEIVRYQDGSEPFYSQKGVTVVGFDQRCAMVLAKELPMIKLSKFTDTTAGMPNGKNFWKADALIAASAVRWEADAIVSADPYFGKLELSIPVLHPKKHLQADQLALPM